MSEENINPTPVNSPQKEKNTSPVKSPKTPRITNSQKEKDPRKVAAGKKLGAISRMAKSQKKYKAEAHNMDAGEKPTQEIQTFYIGLTVCAIVGVLGVVYLKTRTAQEVKPVLPEKQNPKSNLISLD